MSAPSMGIPPGETTQIPAGSRWRSYPLILGGAGAACLVLGLLLSRGDPARFSFSYLVAFMYGLSFALGALFFVIVQHLVKAGWSIVVRRIAENLMCTLPLFALLFIPVALGLSETHKLWWHLKPGADALVDAKAPFLNPPFFLARAAAYLVLWSVLAAGFRARSVAQDESGDHQLTRKQQWWAPPALILYALSVTFAAIDWMKSMEPRWFSTMWGVYYFAGAVVAVFAALPLLARWLQRDGFLTSVITDEHYHDLGKLLFGFVVFWSYIAFSQYFLIWYANLPEETVWFAQRARGGWATAGRVLIFGHFALPFLFLLPRATKRRRALLSLAAAWMLAMHYVDLYYVIMPVHDAATPHPGLVDLLAALGVVSLMLAAWARLSASTGLMPLRDPRLPESLAFENS